MIALYKIQKNKKEEIGWDLDVIYYDKIMKNTQKNTI